ncbi:MAG: ParB/Srx family N-terminal domain-containing protein [Paracoccaceae bacterium]
MADIKTLPESTRLKIAYRKTVDLIPYAGNARTHSDKQIAQIAASIRKFGFTNPVLIDEEGGIVAGHGTRGGSQPACIPEVPTICWPSRRPRAERRAYVIADNRLAELAGWDREILKIEFQALAELDLDFDLEITGFETAELDLLLDSAGEDAGGPGR